MEMPAATSAWIRIQSGDVKVRTFTWRRLWALGNHQRDGFQQMMRAAAMMEIHTKAIHTGNAFSGMVEITQAGSAEHALRWSFDHVTIAIIPAVSGTKTRASMNPMVE